MKAVVETAICRAVVSKGASEIQGWRGGGEEDRGESESKESWRLCIPGGAERSVGSRVATTTATSVLCSAAVPPPGEESGGGVVGPKRETTCRGLRRVATLVTPVYHRGPRCVSAPVGQRRDLQRNAAQRNTAQRNARCARVCARTVRAVSART